MESLLEAALGYAARGWYIIPLRPKSKTPIYKGTYEIASNNPDKILKWWTEHPEANIGICCGLSGLLVLDVDNDSARAALANFTDSINAPCCSTGKGYHYYFACAPDEFRSGVSLMGIRGLDWRCAGGFVVAPPSVHPSGRKYEWKISLAELDPPPVPDWLKQLITQRKPIDSSTATGVVFKEGERNQRLTSIAGSLRARGLDYNQILQQLVLLNKEVCDPPLDFKELQSIARSISKYPPNPTNNTSEKEEPPPIDCGVQSAVIHAGDPPMIEITTDKGKIKALLADFLSPIRFARIWALHFFEIPPWALAKRAAWMAYANSIMLAAEKIEASPDEKDETALAARTKELLERAVEEEDPADLALGRLAIWRKGDGNFCVSFRQLMETLQNEKFNVTRVQLGQILRDLGAHPLVVWSPKLQQAVRVWGIPAEALEARNEWPVAQPPSDQLPEEEIDI